MTSFLIFAALLLVVVLAFLLPPLLGRGRSGDTDEGQRRASNLAIFRSQLAELEREKAEGEMGDEAFEQARSELQRRLLDEVSSELPAPGVAPRKSSWKLALVVVLAVPLLAVGGYFWFGNMRALDPMAAAQQAKMTPDQIQGMVEKLAQRLKDNPGDTDGWLMLARSYKQLGRAAEAADAYGKAESAVNQDPDLLTDYADTLAMLNGGSLRGKPMELINKALHLDPDHVVALWLAGTAAFNNNDYSNTVILWERAMKSLEPNSEDARMLSAAIAEAKKRAGVKADPKLAVSGKVSVAPALATAVSPEDTVFVFARVEGSRMPIAIARSRVADLPFDFVLDDSSAMVADNPISKHASVQVVARVSKSGKAMPTPGDLESEPKTVKLGENKLRIVIDRKL